MPNVFVVAPGHTHLTACRHTADVYVCLHPSSAVHVGGGPKRSKIDSNGSSRPGSSAESNGSPTTFPSSSSSELDEATKSALPPQFLPRQPAPKAASIPEPIVYPHATYKVESKADSESTMGSEAIAKASPLPKGHNVTLVTTGSFEALGPPWSPGEICLFAFNYQAGSSDVSACAYVLSRMCVRVLP